MLPTKLTNDLDGEDLRVRVGQLVRLFRRFLTVACNEVNPNSLAPKNAALERPHYFPARAFSYSGLR